MFYVIGMRYSMQKQPGPRGGAPSGGSGVRSPLKNGGLMEAEPRRSGLDVFLNSSSPECITKVKYKIDHISKTKHRKIKVRFITLRIFFVSVAKWIITFFVIIHSPCEDPITFFGDPFMNMDHRRSVIPRPMIPTSVIP